MLLFIDKSSRYNSVDLSHFIHDSIIVYSSKLHDSNMALVLSNVRIMTYKPTDKLSHVANTCKMAEG